MKTLARNTFLIFFSFLVLAGLFAILGDQAEQPEQVSFSKVVEQVNEGEVERIEVRENDLVVVLHDGTVQESHKEREASLTQSLSAAGVSSERINEVQIEIKSPSGATVWLQTLLPFLIPLLIIGIFIFLIFRQVQGSNNRALTFGQSQARLNDLTNKKKVTFKDVAGAKEAKEELSEVVEFLRTPEKFQSLGARIPKGVLLLGAPGVGKTLMARAVAGEANVPFFHISGSEFVEMFVGVGASRVRDLFKKAKKNAPAIVFVDEIDAVGRQRGAGLGGSHDEREQTLNQILVEMDGFEQDSNVIIIAATNRPDVLDPALLRPGRFDRQVMVDLPDLAERQEILDVHVKGKPLAKDIGLRDIAVRTPGFSGADLSNLINEAAILAARENKKEIGRDHLREAIEKVMIGPERKSSILSPKEKKITAYHEAGHALVATVLPNAHHVHKISIISRGRAGGYIMKLPLEEKRLLSKAEIMDDIAVSLGGYIAEKAVFNEITTGASSDLQQATSMARKLVMIYGMGDKIGPVAFGEKSEMVFLGRDIGEQKNYSEKIAALIDEEITSVINEGYKKAEEVITKHRDQLEQIAKVLIEQETIEREQFEDLLEDVMPEHKKNKYRENPVEADKADVKPKLEKAES